MEEYTKKNFGENDVVLRENEHFGFQYSKWEKKTVKMPLLGFDSMY